MTCLYLHEVIHELPLAEKTLYNLHSLGQINWLERRGRQLAVNPLRCSAWWIERGQLKTAERVLAAADRKARLLGEMFNSHRSAADQEAGGR